MVVGEKGTPVRPLVGGGYSPVPTGHCVFRRGEGDSAPPPLGLLGSATYAPDPMVGTGRAWPGARPDSREMNT